MNLLNFPLLKPLFTAIARQPLIGPHSGYEAALLKAGAKPAAYVHPDQIDELQSDIDAGRLIRKDVQRTLKRNSILLSWPEVNVDDIKASFEFLEKQSWRNPAGTDLTAAFNRARNETGLAMTLKVTPRDKLSVVEKAAITAFLQLPSAVQTRFWVPHKIMRYVSLCNTAEFLNGERRALIIPDYAASVAFGAQDGPLHARRAQLVEKGAIRQTSHTVSVTDTMPVIAQAGQEQAAEDLGTILREYDRSYDEHSLPPTREGEALGYSDADINLWLQGPGAMSPLLRLALQHTNGIRRDLRCAMMKEAGPNWSRNP